ncbi:hypothetical protein A1O1_07263 [Capronia coronata CBS 617.96]|uniref:Uncharacterized protein n=1 Tax=Capronia coronata CBS 617.96 TaxID=1182541 RepID=W9YMZ5_9EURO|nr:uncharacterized protein A1O1_07263 [Capronia coronata CBS 617.96]EXJ83639.1 hypothetical protein A1O1_07263 [Capronia coronata CBS 617.96]
MGMGKDTFTLLLFASASTYTGAETLTLPAPSSLRQIFTTLERMYPGFVDKVLKSAAVTVNLEYLDIELDGLDPASTDPGSTTGLDMLIKPGDEVGIIPPVSSG